MAERPKRTDRVRRILWVGLFYGALCWVPSLAAQTSASTAGFAYIGTLDKKLLIYDEKKEEIAGEIPLQGIPRQTVLTRDQSKLVIMTTMMAIETVDLKSRKMINHFSLADEKSKPRTRGMAMDPTGRYLYASMRASVKE